MDKPIAAEANRHFSRVSRDVRSGDRLVGTARGRPVPRLVPMSDTDAKRDAAHATLLRRVISQPAQNLPRWTRDELYEDDAPCCLRRGYEYAVILAAAARADCHYLPSKDMQDGFCWRGVPSPTRSPPRSCQRTLRDCSPPVPDPETQKANRKVRPCDSAARKPHSLSLSGARSGRGPLSCPLADGSRSTSSITAMLAASP